MSIPETLQPTSKPGRIAAMDTIRGISLFAILLMNIIGFGLYKAYFDLQTTVAPQDGAYKEPRWQNQGE